MKAFLKENPMIKWLLILSVALAVLISPLLYSCLH